MNDEEMAKFLGLAGEPKGLAVVRGLTPEKRALFERMAEVEMEVMLWVEGVGPKPEGVLIDFDRKAFR